MGETKKKKLTVASSRFGDSGGLQDRGSQVWKFGRRGMTTRGSGHAREWVFFFSLVLAGAAGTLLCWCELGDHGAARAGVFDGSCFFVSWGETRADGMQITAARFVMISPED